MTGIRGPRLLRVGAATAMTLLGAPAAVAAADTTPSPPSPPPGVTVAVLGGSAPAGEHAAIDYTIEVRDAGSEPYRHVDVTAMLPAGFHLVRTSPPTVAGPASVATWATDLAPGQSVDIHARVAAGTVQDLAQVPESPTGPSDVLDGSGSGGMAWYSLSACAQRGPADVPVCGLSRQLLVKSTDDTRQGIEAIVLILGVPLVVGGLALYAWRAWREPEAA